MHISFFRYYRNCWNVTYVVSTFLPVALWTHFPRTSIHFNTLKIFFHNFAEVDFIPSFWIRYHHVIFLYFIHILKTQMQCHLLPLHATVFFRSINICTKNHIALECCIQRYRTNPIFTYSPRKNYYARGHMDFILLSTGTVTQANQLSK